MRNWMWIAIVAVVVVAAALVVMARRWPPIHDISTDLDDPPPFVALVPLRTGRVSPAEYDGAAAAAQQRRFYPEVQPLLVASPPDAVFGMAAGVARDQGWQIVSEDRAAGRIEAIATTRLMRFKDDLVIRIRAVQNGTRVDVRSKSRVGVGDLGTNARRITKYLDALRARSG